MKVLIVDDDPISVQILENAVQANGHDVLVATDGMGALEILQRTPCRLVISDWEMPHMNGLELCHAIRFGDFSGYIYVILLTSHAAPREKVLGLNAGADDLIAKPFDPAELSARLLIAERILSLETRDVAMFAMAKLAESRDPETGAHLERMQNYSRVLAWQLAAEEPYQHLIDREYLRLIYATSPLHDIGKVGVPDSVLLKAGRLTPEEFEIMKLHTTIGSSTLTAALTQFPGAKFLEMARDIASSHHEKYDGSGYPDGLAGEDIPLSARIVAVADVYDALTSKRVYKEAYSHDITREMILQKSGTHFDPHVAEAFVACESQFIAIAEQFREQEPFPQSPSQTLPLVYAQETGR